MMKNTTLVAVAFTLALGCKEAPKKEDQTETSIPKKASSTLAEFSVGEGGHWEGHSYKGLVSYKDVDSLWVPQEHTDHSDFLRHDGPGWESDKVAYRIYLDWRAATDIYGKKTDTTIMDQVGRVGTPSYHEMQPWGMDLLAVGNSLGLGGYGRMVGDSVYHFQTVDSTFAKAINSTDLAQVGISYKGWQAEAVKTDLSVTFSIAAGSRASKTILQTPKPVEGLVTGMVKFEGIDLIQKKSNNGKWACIATYGVQTVVPDQMGMAIFYPVDEVAAVVEGHDDHLLVFKPTTDPITYYFSAAWEKEHDGITNQADFETYLDQELERLSE